MLLFTDYTTFDKNIIFKLGEIQKELEEHFSRFPELSVHWIGENFISTGILDRTKESVFLDKYSESRLKEIRQWLEGQESIPDLDKIRKSPTLLYTAFNKLNKSKFKISEEVLNLQGLNFQKWDLLYLRDLWNWRLFHQVDINKKSNFSLLFERLNHSELEIKDEYSDRLELEFGKISISLFAYSYIEMEQNFLFEEYFSYFFQKHHSKFYSLNKSLKIFVEDFLTIPFEYIDSKKRKKSGIFAWLDKVFKAGMPDSDKDIANRYEELTPTIIVNGQSFISYFFGLNYFFDLEKSKFRESFNLGDFPQYFLDEEPDYPQIWANEIFMLLHLKIEMANAHFDIAFNNLKSKIPNKKIFKNDQQLLQFLIEVYQDIKRQSNYKLQIFNRIKLPQIISNLLIDCYVELFKKKLAEINGELSESFLLPSQLESLFYPIRQIQPKPDLSNTVHIKRFVEEKIPIPEEKQLELEQYFSLLFRTKSEKGKPFMDQENVQYLLKTNFSCYKEAFAPKVFQFNGNKMVFRYFIFQVYDKFSTLGISKERMTQFAIQNFDLYFKKDLTEKNFQDLFSNIRNNKPKKAPFISLDRLEKLENI